MADNHGTKMVLSSSSRSLIMLWGKWEGVWETQIKELALTGKQFLKPNTSHVSALEVSFLLREDFLEWAIEVGYWMFFVLFFFIRIFIYMYTLSDQRSWAISDFALIVNERYSLAAYRSKASKQARLVKRKVCFVSDASNCRGVQTSVQRLTPPTLQPPTPHNWHPVR